MDRSSEREGCVFALVKMFSLQLSVFLLLVVIAGLRRAVPMEAKGEWDCVQLEAAAWCRPRGSNHFNFWRVNNWLKFFF